MGLNRRADWAPRLLDWLERARAGRFALGRHDCVTLAADAVAAVTGQDPLGDLRGAWRCRDSARRVLADAGGDLAAAVSARLGEPAGERGMTGDVALVTLPAARPCGVLLARDVVAVPARRGVRLLRLRDLRPYLVWSVG